MWMFHWYTENVGFSIHHKYAFSTLDNQIFMAIIIQFKYNISPNMPFIVRSTIITSTTKKSKIAGS